jgi:hypothetical protein
MRLRPKRTSGENGSRYTTTMLTTRQVVYHTGLTQSVGIQNLGWLVKNFKALAPLHATKMTIQVVEVEVERERLRMLREEQAVQSKALQAVYEQAESEKEARLVSSEMHRLEHSMRRREVDQAKLMVYHITKKSVQEEAKRLADEQKVMGQIALKRQLKHSAIRVQYRKGLWAAKKDAQLQRSVKLAREGRRRAQRLEHLRSLVCSGKK